MPFYATVKTSMVAAILLCGSAIMPASAEQAMGSKLAAKYCARCHAIGMADASPHPSAPPFRKIAARGQVDNLQEALAEGITVGHPDMPEFQLPPEQVADFIAYLKSLVPGRR